MPSLSQIFVYPIKGFQGVELKAAMLAKGEGLTNDRHQRTSITM